VCLIKSAVPYSSDLTEAEKATMLSVMHSLNPAKKGGGRQTNRLCSGQTLLCRALGLKVPVLRASGVVPPT
jgi:DNA-3-methyladenine glycosylase